MKFLKVKRCLDITPASPSFTLIALNRIECFLIDPSKLAVIIYNEYFIDARKTWKTSDFVANVTALAGAEWPSKILSCLGIASPESKIQTLIELSAEVET